ncbi:MAG: serine hydrolase [Pseudomonadota bacterium]
MNIKSRIERITTCLRPAASDPLAAPQTLYDRMAYYHTPGASIAVINNFEIEWAQGFGISDTQLESKVTPDTLFQAASISKPIFALAVMKLVQEGKLNLDEDIHHYLSSWRLPFHEEWKPKLTLRHLLSHMGGLTVPGFPGYQKNEMLPTLIQILNGEYPANTAKVNINSLPGTLFRYSGGGTLIAQQLMMDVLKIPFSEMMRELVFEPLGLDSSSFEYPLPEAMIKRTATGHPKKGVPVRGDFHIYPNMASSGLWTTPTDLAKVGVELLKVLHDKKTPSILKKDTIETMLLSQQLNDQKINESQGVGLGLLCNVGLGFFCNGTNEGFHFGHCGWNEGFVSQLRLYKNTGKGAIVMLNSNEGYPLLNEIMNAIGEEYEWANSTRKIAIDLPDYQEYVGQYISKSGVTFQVTVTDDHLMFQYGIQPPLPIFPLSQNTFFSNAVNTEISFERNEKEVISLTILQDGQQIHALKESKQCI